MITTIGVADVVAYGQNQVITPTMTVHGRSTWRGPKRPARYPELIRPKKEQPFAIATSDTARLWSTPASVTEISAYVSTTHTINVSGCHTCPQQMSERAYVCKCPENPEYWRYRRA